jgi:hypothetical protein
VGASLHLYHQLYFQRITFNPEHVCGSQNKQQLFPQTSSGRKFSMLSRLE